MHSAVRWLVVALLCLVTLPAAYAQTWYRAKTSRLTLYTTAPPPDARAAVEVFESTLANLSSIFGLTGDLGPPIRMVAFRSAAEFRPYSPNSFTAAYYMESGSQDWVVMRSMGEAEREVAVHELTHLLIRRSGQRLPLWYNEGIADFYSTLRPAADGKIRIGEPLAGRVNLLARKPWLPLQVLLGASANSPHYNERDRAGILYAQSWALVHMLNISDEYRDRLSQLLGMLREDRPPANAFRRVYGKSLEEVEDDLAAHVRERLNWALEFDAPWRDTRRRIEISRAGDLESGLVLGNLLEGLGKLGEAYAHYERLARQYPQEPEPEERLGAASLRGRNTARATSHFRRAAGLGSANARVYFLSALLLQQQSAAPAEIMPLLETAVRLDPDMPEALELLGLHAFESRDYRKALSCWKRIREVRPDRAFFLFRASALASQQLGHRDDALHYVQLAQAHASTPEERSALERLITLLQ